MERLVNFQWLYIFACKGIQDYIFRSDRLRPMVGASALIDRLPGPFLEEVITDLGISELDHTILSQAAGGARILFRQESDARDLARVLPLLAGEEAPGLDVFQAIVPMEGDLFSALKDAEKELRARRNYLSPVLPPAGPLIRRNQRSGLPAETYENIQGEVVSREIAGKLSAVGEASRILTNKVSPEEFHGQSSRWPLDFDDIASEDNAYLAVIHADANGMGQVLMMLGDLMRKAPDRAEEVYREFSRGVDEASKGAARAALKPVLEAADRRDDDNEDGKEPRKFPVRPIICAGDDLTVVIGAPYAPGFVRDYLENFEKLAGDVIDKLGVEGLPNLTACAGIAFVKKSFPFSQAYDLAESLCRYSKKKVQRQASALAFWRQTTSAGTDYQTILEQELTAGKIRLTMNPYRVSKKEGDGTPLLVDLISLLDAVKKLPRGSLRGVISAAYSGYEPAQRAFDRLCQVAETKKGREKEGLEELQSALKRITNNEDEPLWTSEDKDKKKRTPLFDALELYALKTLID